MDKVEKLLWMYMIEHGHVGATWSFYGGRYEEETGKANEDLLKAVKKYGVDWKKTQPVREDNHSTFTDTFHDADWDSVLEGELVLKNKKKYKVGTTASAPEILKAMSHYIVDCFEDMK